MNYPEGNPILSDRSGPTLLRASMQWIRARNAVRMERLLGVFLWAAFFAVLLSLGE